MRLVNSTTYELGNFSGQIPEYAILSHTWEKEELSFQDIQRPNAKQMAGYAKIEGCCVQARQDGFKWVWIDTCCIDKTSSAELSEAINSMYQWYKEAQVCYAYLADVPPEQDLQSPNSLFAKSRWFKRGWTLQELIGPLSLVFYGESWWEIGTKLSLQKQVSDITGIPVSVLKFGHIGSFSVAQKMSWASKRQTTRLEDQAYCLMGLFDVNMPMLYGEGKRAFARLQEEIMKTSDDHTLFTWTELGDERRWITRGALADSPAEFVNSGDIVQSSLFLKSVSYSMTNKGLHIELPLFPIDDRRWFAILNCKRLSSDNDDLLGIFLEQLPREKEEYFARTVADEVNPIGRDKVEKSEKRAIYIVQKNIEDLTIQELGILRPFRVCISIKQSGLGGYRISDVYSSSNEWKKLSDGCFQFVGRRNGLLVVLMFRCQDAADFVVILGHQHGLAWCHLETDIVNKSLVRIYDRYRLDSHADRLDRISKRSQGGGSVAVAIRKTAKLQRSSEHNYDGEYAVRIAIHERTSEQESESLLLA